MEEKRVCQNTGQKYCEGEFVIMPDDFLFYDKIKVPPPTFCTTCRMQRRFAFRNQNRLFKNKSAFSGKDILALIPLESNVQVVTQEEWFSDAWDAMDYGIDFNFSVPFFEQLFELHKKIPQSNLNVARMINSDYSGNAEDMKNCYMVFNALGNEDCMYGTGYYSSKNCVDNCDIFKSEFCYGSIWLENCSKTYFSEECRQCINVWFSRNCVSCMDCVGCVNLKNKSYCIENVQYTREEYFKKLEELNFSIFSSIEKYGKYIRKIWASIPRKYSQGLRNMQSSGVYVTESKNVTNSYLVKGGENLKFVQFINEGSNKDCYDISAWGLGSELAYEYSSCGTGIYNSKFIVDCWPDIRDSEYSLHSRSSSNIFGCIGVQKKEYCILNKQYTKEVYLELVSKIKEQMINMPYIDGKGRVYRYGEFFPIEFSWYGYNNTLAQEFLPLEKEEVEAEKYPWYEIPQTIYEASIQSNEIPDDVKEASSSILNEVIQCSTCYKKYKIVKPEFEFLQREKLPLPRSCADCRYQERISKRLKTKLFHIKCMHANCENKFETGYDPKDKYIVYCESCYQQEFI